MYNFKWIYIKVCSISIIGKLLKNIRNKLYLIKIRNKNFKMLIGFFVKYYDYSYQ